MEISKAYKIKEARRPLFHILNISVSLCFSAVCVIIGRDRFERAQRAPFLERECFDLQRGDFVENSEYIPEEREPLDEQAEFESELEPETEPDEDEEEDSGKGGKKSKKKKKNSAKREIYEWIQCLMTALMACVLLFVFFLRTIGVVGDSMTNTLHEGDRIIISNLFYTPEQGDIVVLRKETFREQAIVKRVIATEGQTIKIDFDRGIVYVDGKELNEPYIREPTYAKLDFSGEATVPEGCVFVMGDNRNGSTDSRDDRIGFVDTRCILGRALFRVYPMDVFGKIE